MDAKTTHWSSMRVDKHFQAKILHHFAYIAFLVPLHVQFNDSYTLIVPTTPNELSVTYVVFTREC